MEAQNDVINDVRGSNVNFENDVISSFTGFSSYIDHLCT